MVAVLPPVSFVEGVEPSGELTVVSGKDTIESMLRLWAQAAPALSIEAGGKGGVSW